VLSECYLGDVEETMLNDSKGNSNAFSKFWEFKKSDLGEFAKVMN
jgi:hypothetical protein